MQGSANTPVFGHFMLALVKYMGDNSAAAILDSSAFHKTAFALGCMASGEVKPLFLPPYTPEGNCIELVFGLIKRKLLTISIDNVGDLALAIQTHLKLLEGSILISTFSRSFKDVCDMIKSYLNIGFNYQ